ncbi:hypothetical protein [Streptomyces hydrogenans]|uniref:Uncharacterized protein n=1 Tax=Streptomyces hydrogenans TaxID=1873719 RepID=A0ABQ3PQF4_9ACTN|nr:hypothetical protein [Streptomyces hydrogenans]GHG24554.1 hypothetical protein GCM10018784_42390 [Streptomyces hydrogenans]GHI27252.1 hypothetical protein Shyd_86230 [Streptomyces hydrogenans]
MTHRQQDQGEYDEVRNRTDASSANANERVERRGDVCEAVSPQNSGPRRGASNYASSNQPHQSAEGDAVTQATQHHGSTLDFRPVQKIAEHLRADQDNVDPTFGGAAHQSQER